MEYTGVVWTGPPAIGHKASSAWLFQVLPYLKQKVPRDTAEVSKGNEDVPHTNSDQMLHTERMGGDGVWNMMNMEPNEIGIC